MMIEPFEIHEILCQIKARMDSLPKQGINESQSEANNLETEKKQFSCWKPNSGKNIARCTNCQEQCCHVLLQRLGINYVGYQAIYEGIKMQQLMQHVMQQLYRSNENQPANPMEKG